MNVRDKLLAISACSALAMAAAAGLGVPAFAQQAPNEAGRASAVNSTRGADSADIANLPDSPGAALTKEKTPLLLQVAQSQAPANDNTSHQVAADQSGTPQTQNQSQSNPASPQRPVGTAAAEAPTTTGVAASEPAGVAIAPAKQHRARTIIIRTGAIIGAAVAVGVVVALTEATSSRPPGAH